jgi:hypothetical protein
VTDIRGAYKVVIEPLSEEDGGGAVRNRTSPNAVWAEHGVSRHLRGKKRREGFDRLSPNGVGEDSRPSYPTVRAELVEALPSLSARTVRSTINLRVDHPARSG